ncbi:hypothetical protein G6F66_015345 [Rhizopus arrhizus]|nr:hypothetical protein G6F66_015345 [Rhizopus arrhizus]
MDEGQGDLSTLLAAADAALYPAKAAGRDQLACAPAAAISPFPIAVEAVPVGNEHDAKTPPRAGRNAGQPDACRLPPAAGSRHPGRQPSP